MDGQNMNNQNAYSQELQEKVALKQLHKGKGIAATILGIISLIGCLGPIAFICGIVAIFVGANARKKSKKTTGTAGMVMGIIGVVISIIGTVLIIAMMAGVMAPQVVSYTDKVEVSQDTMMCDTVKTALTVALMDPSVSNDTDSIAFVLTYGDGNYHDISVIFENDCKYTQAVQATLNIYSYDELCDTLNSSGADTMEFAIDDYGVSVRIPGTEIEAY